MARLVALLVALCCAGCGGCGHEPEQTGAAAGGDVALVDDATMDATIAAATRRALASHQRVLLVFVAEHDEDTRLVRRFLAEEPAATAVAAGYQRVFVDLGSGPVLHPRLRYTHDVTSLVTFVVVDPATGRRVARQVFAPASGNGTVTAQTLAAWLDDPHGR